uniref:hypothetical protein n=1 Tax=Chitinophaga sp. TaxID=1869181 RepID=UPI003FA5FF7A
MKKFVIAATVSAVAMASCGKFLEEDPKGSITPQTFYKTTEDLHSATLGLALLLLSPTLAHATFAPPQAPTRWATDTAGFISTEALRGLDAQLEAAQVQTGRHVILW